MRESDLTRRMQRLEVLQRGIDPYDYTDPYEHLTEQDAEALTDDEAVMWAIVGLRAWQFEVVAYGVCKVSGARSAWCFWYRVAERATAVCQARGWWLAELAPVEIARAIELFRSGDFTVRRREWWEGASREVWPADIAYRGQHLGLGNAGKTGRLAIDLEHAIKNYCIQVPDEAIPTDTVGVMEWLEALHGAAEAAEGGYAQED